MPGRVAVERPKSHVVRHCLRLLGMVHELHKVGYQRLRAETGMSPSGIHWRCNIAPDRGWEGQEPARYTSAAETEYFGWKDARHDNARELAAKFIVRFPELCICGAGLDFAYAGWFTAILGIAESGRLPVSFADYPLDLDPVYWPPPPPQR